MNILKDTRMCSGVTLKRKTRAGKRYSLSESGYSDDDHQGIRRRWRKPYLARAFHGDDPSSGEEQQIPRRVGHLNRCKLRGEEDVDDQMKVERQEQTSNTRVHALEKDRKQSSKAKDIVDPKNQIDTRTPKGMWKNLPSDPGGESCKEDVLGSRHGLYKD